MARKPVYKTALGRRLADVREKFGQDREELAATLGNVSAGSLANYERGDNVPDANLVATYHSKLNVSLQWLITGEGDMFDDPTKAPSAPITVEQTDFRQFANTMVQKIGSLERRLEPPPPPPATIKFFPQAASAGWGRAVLDDEGVEELDMEAFASRLLGLDPDHVTLFPIKGDSMYPTLQQRDYAVVDRRKRRIVDDAIFVVSIDNDLYIKRAKREDDACCWLSDNPDQSKYPPIFLKGDELRRMKVVGQVTNVLRKL